MFKNKRTWYSGHTYNPVLGKWKQKIKESRSSSCHSKFKANFSYMGPDSGERDRDRQKEGKKKRKLFLRPKSSLRTCVL